MDVTHVWGAAFDPKTTGHVNRGMESPFYEAGLETQKEPCAIMKVVNLQIIYQNWLCSRKYFKWPQNQEGFHPWPFSRNQFGFMLSWHCSTVAYFNVYVSLRWWAPNLWLSMAPCVLAIRPATPPSFHFWSVTNKLTQVIRYRIRLISVADDRCQQVSDQVATLIWKYGLVTKSCLHFCPFSRTNPQFGWLL